MVWTFQHLCSEQLTFSLSDMSSNAAISVRIGDVESPSTYWVYPLATSGDERHSAIFMLEKVGQMKTVTTVHRNNQSIW